MAGEGGAEGLGGGVGGAAAADGRVRLVGLARGGAAAAGRGAHDDEFRGGPLGARVELHH